MKAMRKIFILSLICLIIFSTKLYSQLDKNEVKGNKAYESYSYSKAINNYKKADFLTIAGQRKLAKSYRKTNQFYLAVEMYKKFSNSSEVLPEDLFEYASLLRIIGNYEQSDIWMRKFHKAQPNDTRGERFTTYASTLPELLNDDGRFVVRNLRMNSSHQDFGTSYYGDKILFSSTREFTTPIRRIYNWTQKPFLNIHVADVKNGNLQNITRLKNINKKYHEGPASYAQQVNILAFTANNYNERSSDGVSKLEIYFTSRLDGRWSKQKPFYLNNKEYSVGHPSITKDGNTMFFASDMPGGRGGVDLYMVTKRADGEWGQAINLGGIINTEGDEMFPFYHEKEEILFFASNGNFGLGGLDIFYSQRNSDGQFGQPVNIGVPVNSSYDDFAFIINEEMQTGFFSSNRITGRGDDDMYSFEMQIPIQIKKMLVGTSLDKDGNILSQTKVTLFDEEGDIAGTVITDETGKYEFVVEADKDWKLEGVKENYYDGHNQATTKTPEPIVYADVILEKIPTFSLYVLITEKHTKQPLQDVKVSLTNTITKETEIIITPKSGDFLRQLDNKLNDRISYNLKLEAKGYLAKNLTYTKILDREGQYNVHEELDISMDKIEEGVTRLETIIEINPIYFDLNKFNIRTDAAKELDKIVKVMNENPTMVIELGSHTDCRSSYQYNMWLSDQRAKASAAYVKARITNPERIYGKGYGESQLVNDCACEGAIKSDCTEEQHQLNRRTEFKIIKM
jgi:outer membrane protein OmpA-like peptidoglycan-associated protein/tetratricopeptide (TPR) repeat protein